VQKFFMKVKGIASQRRFGVYILSGLARMGIYAKWLLHGFQKNGKTAAKTIRQNIQDKNCY
jgi:hypothetical protein